MKIVSLVLGQWFVNNPFRISNSLPTKTKEKNEPQSEKKHEPPRMESKKYALKYANNHRTVLFSAFPIAIKRNDCDLVWFFCVISIYLSSFRCVASPIRCDCAKCCDFGSCFVTSVGFPSSNHTQTHTYLLNHANLPNLLDQKFSKKNRLNVNKSHWKLVE